MAMEVDRLTVKVDTDFRGLTSGLKSATRDVQGFKREVEGTQAQMGRGGDFPVRTDTRQVDLAKSKVGGLRQDLSNGGTFEVRADDSQLAGVTGHLSALRSDAANGGTFVMRADESQLAGVPAHLSALRADAANGGTFNLDADTTGLAGASAEIQALQAEIAGADNTMHVNADFDDAGAVAGIQALKAESAGADDTIHVDADFDGAGAIAGMTAFGTATMGASTSGGLFASTALTIGTTLAVVAAAGVAAAAAVVPVLGGVAAIGAVGAAAAVGLGLVAGSIWALVNAQGPLGEAFAELSDHLTNVQDQFQAAFEPAAALIPPIGDKALDVAENYIPLLGTAAEATIGAMTPALNSFLTWLDEGGAGFSFLTTIIEGAAPIMGALTDALVSFGQGLIAIFAAATPAAVSLADSIAAIAQRFAEWATSAEGQQQITDAIAAAVPVFQALWDAVVAISGALLRFSEVAGPLLAPTIEALGIAISGTIDFITIFADAVIAAGNAIGDAVTAVGDWIAGLESLHGGPSIWDVIMGDAAAEENPILNAVMTAWTAVTEFIGGLAPDITLMDVIMGGASLDEAAAEGGIAANIISALSTAWTAVSEWIGGLAPEITLMDVIMGGATMEEAAAEGGIAATIITSLTEAWTAVTEWIAGLAPEITLMDVIMGTATMEQAAEEGGIAATIIASLGEAWTAVNEWIAGLAPEITLMDVIMGNATMEEAAGSGNIAAQAIELLQSAWDSVMEWLGGLVPDISLTDIILGVENVATAVGEFIAAIGDAFASGWATITQTFSDFFTSLYNDYWLYYFGADGVLVTGVLDFFSVLYNDYWLYYFGADGVLVTGILDFFTALYNDYWLYYFGPDGVLITGILDFFTVLYNDYWLYYFGLDGVLITGILDFFTMLYNDYWLYYFGLDGVLITGILDFFTTLYNDYWLYYFGLDGVLVTGIIDFFTSLYNDYWLYYFGLDGVLITGIIDFFTTLYNDYWLYYFGLDGALIGPIIDFFTSLYNDYFLYYLGPGGVVVDAVQDAWDAILTAIPEFVRSFANLLGNGIASGINAAIGFLQGLLDAIDSVLTAINVSPLGVTLPTVTFEEFAKGGSTESMAAGGSRGGAGSRARQPKHIIWDEGMGEEYWIATGPAADKRKNVGWLAKAASKLGLGVVPMQAGGVIGSGGRLAGIGRTQERYDFTYLAREFPDETTTTSTASTASTVGAATTAAGEKKLTRKQKRRERRKARREKRRGAGTTTTTGLTGTTPTTSGTSGTTAPTSGASTTMPTSSVPGTSAVDAMPAGTADLAAPAGMTRAPTVTGGSKTGRRRGRARGRTHRGGARFSNMRRGRRRHKRAGGGDTTFMAIGGGTDVGPAGLGERAGGIAQEIMDAFGVWANTYVGGATPHGSLHGNVPENTFDFWGDSGFTPLDVGTGDAILQYLYDNYGSELDTVIWQGIGEGPGGSFDDGEHFDHLHASIGGGGILGGAGSVALALFNKMKGIWDSAMSALGDPVLGEGPLWDGIETYLMTLPMMAWEWLKSKVPRGTGSSIVRGLGPSGNVLELAQQGIELAGWPESELSALSDLWQNESGWDANIVNPESGAYGIPQILPSAHPDGPPLGDAAGQIEWGLNYISERYGSPSAALDFWLANGWYRAGGVVPGAPGSTELGVLHGGERVLPQNINRGFENLAQAVDRWDDNSASGMGGAGANSEAEAVLEEILVEIKRGNDSPTPVDINNLSAMQRLVYNSFMAGIESDASTEVLDKKMAEGVRFASTLGGL